MSKEKQIEEMAQTICNGCHCHDKCVIDGICDAVLENANTLYNAGYRKQSENTADVVRCRDCELCAINTVLGTFRCWRFKSIVNPNDFCSYGRKRKECGNDTQAK